ncbi:hypothetical protein [Lysinibacillus tabacifolii]|uniref:Lipoprotein n=1 Tax=Lysinibacillus tabacifolii TaxID=1173107 RepID=A0ABY2T3F4_9BACI|nr:hypothetical protein [Lysinibacillus tabacifolii]TKI50557.1 hypothetical protein FC748_04915 [Lysinibacillus tabacifolii]
MKKLFYVGALSAFLLAACGDENEAAPKEEAPASEQAEPAKESVTAETAKWQDEITKLATNSDSPADKFYALEKFLMEYNPTEAEVKEFSTYIVNDYKSGNYLSEIENHERMLTNIFKSYFVEKNSEGALKDFAFDYFQNMKYTYRSVDAVDSEAVKSNEKQMNKALEKMK